MAHALHADPLAGDRHGNRVGRLRLLRDYPKEIFRDISLSAKTLSEEIVVAACRTRPNVTADNGG